MKLTEEEVADFSNDSAGYCRACDDVTNFSSVEPDAENYECDKCGKLSVMGIELAVVLGKISISDMDFEEE